MSGSDTGPGAPAISANNESNKPSSADSGGWPVKKARATPGHPLWLRPWFYAHICDMCSLADWNVKAAAANKNASWQTDGSPAGRVMGNWLCLTALMPAASEGDHNHTSLSQLVDVLQQGGGIQTDH